MVNMIKIGKTFATHTHTHTHTLHFELSEVQ